MDIKVILGIIIIVIAVIGSVVWFIKLPNATKIENIKEWLKYAVTEAEKTLGSGTGQLKLHLVYDMAIKQFPWIAQVVTFSTFSEWVDDALVWMRGQLKENSAVEQYVSEK